MRPPSHITDAKKGEKKRIDYSGRIPSLSSSFLVYKLGIVIIFISQNFNRNEGRST